MESFKSAEYTRFWDMVLSQNSEPQKDDFDWFVSVSNTYPF